MFGTPVVVNTSRSCACNHRLPLAHDAVPVVDNMQPLIHPTEVQLRLLKWWLEGFDGEQDVNDRGDRHVGCSTIPRCLDRITLGPQPARLYLLLAHTSVGKSQLAHQVALHVARHHGPVVDGLAENE
jgi:hypothetical protein